MVAAVSPRKLPGAFRPAPVLALLYTALLAFANPAAAAPLSAEQRAELEALREGDMRKLVVHAEPLPAPEVAFSSLDGTPETIADSDGQIRLVNFWATWCAPCRREKPALDALQRDLGGEDFAVIAIATGRNSPEAIERFNEELGITALETHLDPEGALAAAMNIPGLPVTVLLDRDGAELGRLMGGGDWDQPSAHAIVRYLTDLAD